MSIKDLKNTTVMSVQKFNTKYWIEVTYSSCSWRKRFNCDQCGKNFARGCNLNDYEIDSWIELWKSPFLDLKFKKGHIQIVHEGVLIFPK